MCLVSTMRLPGNMERVRLASKLNAKLSQDSARGFIFDTDMSNQSSQLTLNVTDVQVLLQSLFLSWYNEIHIPVHKVPIGIKPGYTRV